MQMPEMPQAQRGVPAPGAQGAVAPTAGTEPTEAGSYNGEDVRRLATSMKDRSNEELREHGVDFASLPFALYREG